MENGMYPFINLPLSFEYNALEPFIDQKTMYLHHERHLQAYIDNLNKALEKCPKLQSLTLKQLVCGCRKPLSEAETAVKNNAGGVYNHRFFFGGLSPEKSEPSGELLKAVERQFGSFNSFKEEFKKEAMSVFGSGYAWLVKDGKCLKIIKTANQDSLVAVSVKPILTVDVWEHAYYLKHYNLRADYINDWFNVVNWNQAENNFNTL